MDIEEVLVWQIVRKPKCLAPMQTEKIKVNQKLRCVNDISASVKTFNKVKNRDKLQKNRLKMKIPKNETQYPYNYEKRREFSLG